MLYVFLGVCWQDYVWKNDESTKKKFEHEICTHIFDLKQARKLPGGKTETVTPDILYTDIISIVAGLLEDTSL